MKKIFLSLLFCSSLGITAQDYIPPKEAGVQQKLKQWQDKKFGLIIHWGLYSIPGIVESWNLCSEEEDWIPRPADIKYDDYKKWYWGLSKQFNPVKFNPDAWAKMAKEAGMQYVVFSTKHHDGFNLFDTQQTDFKVTNPEVPFSKNPKSNIAKEVFNAFRKEGLWVGAYFSKPDWHSENYWWPRYATPNRNNNYSITKNPERWNAFKKYTYNQLEELATQYGKLDLFWLDGGWVRPSDPEKYKDDKSYKGSQDIDMDKIAAMLRGHQKDLIIVDRSVHGIYENYTTPEREIPEKPLNYPWEACDPLGDNWGYVPNDPMKSTNKVIHTLAEIISKGGNYLLGIGPDGNGEFDPRVTKTLNEIGSWIRVNGEAVYGTKPVAPYADGNLRFTQKGNAVYAFYLIPENSTQLPGNVSFSFPGKIRKISVLSTGKALKFNQKGNTITIQTNSIPSQKHAVVFKME
ncbi:alpha-L-fucosidase [Elizabethkingia meningoseptica]|uniref:alpha-L-fucosidase n=1 Tax=Elizabethkingia meningoseptica TaxID=238 RepID=UPI0020135B6F|nr:alpha-L-fucosidase [Elizabethkingia meningoseptica]MCL1676423.1 alpha-L-fucosidase [Elizabethkingia meningoseptica]MCL1687897.1 alpha-L-fucosidase [Elizabethkingia meningoseptica]